MTQPDENYITDPDSTPVETIVQRIIENVVHASKKVGELHDWTVTGTGQLLLIHLETRLENIGRLAESLAKRVEPGTNEEDQA